jgi:hypothetical protein
MLFTYRHAFIISYVKDSINVTARNTKLHIVGYNVYGCNVNIYVRGKGASTDLVITTSPEIRPFRGKVLCILPGDGIQVQNIQNSYTYTVA